MTITTHHQPYLLIYKLATLLPEEYCDYSIRVFRSDCSIRVYRSFKQVFRGPFMGPPGASFRLGPGEKCPSCPPLWAALQGGFGWFGRTPPFRGRFFFKLKITPNLTALDLSGSYLPTGAPLYYS